MGGFAGELNKDILALTMILSGLFVCFFGAKFFKHIIFFVGFVVGGLGSYFLVPDFLGLFGFNISDDMLLYVSLACGAALGVLFVVIYKAAVFSCGAIAGVLLAQAIWQSIIIPLNIDDEIPEPDVFQVIAWIIFALLGGYLAFKLAEFVLKGITAFIGAFMFASSVAYFIARIENKSEAHDTMSWLSYFTTSSSYKNITNTCDAYCYICLSLWILLSVCGCYIQYKFHKKHKRQDYDDDMSESGESDDELDERKAKREQQKAARKARKGGSVQEVRDGSAEMSGQYVGQPVQSYSGASTGRASYYSSNSGYNGYNGYSPNHASYNGGYNSSGQYYSAHGGAPVNYV